MTLTGAASLTVGFFSECNFLVLSLTSTRVFITLSLFTLSSFNSSSGISLWEDPGSERMVAMDSATSEGSFTESGDRGGLMGDPNRGEGD